MIPLTSKAIIQVKIVPNNNDDAVGMLSDDILALLQDGSVFVPDAEPGLLYMRQSTWDRKQDFFIDMISRIEAAARIIAR